MANTRLPKPGGDRGNWGDVLNAFLKRAHNEDGTLKDTGVLAEKYNKPTSGIPESDLAAGVQTKLNNGAPDADTDTKGVIKLGGDLGGTADNPTVPGLAAKLDSGGGELTGIVTGNYGSQGGLFQGPIFGVPVLGLYNQYGQANPSVLLAPTGLQFGAGGSSAPDASISRSAANVLQIGADDWLRGTLAPVHDNDFTNKSYVDQATARVLGWIDASDYGTVADAKFFSDGSITASDNTFTSSSASFTNADVGKTIIIAGAIDSETCLVTTIASRNSSTSVELTDAAETTVTGANGAYGTDDQPALSAAFAAARAAEKPLYIPKGDYLIADSIYDATLSGDNGFGCIVKGAGKHLTRIIPAMNDYIFNVVGSTGIGGVRQLTAPASRGDRTVSVSSTTSLAKGMYVFMKKKDAPVFGNNDNTQSGILGDVVQIKSISGNDVTFVEPLQFDYSSDSDKTDFLAVGMRRYVEYTDLGFYDPAPEAWGSGLNIPIATSYCKEVFIARCHFENMNSVTITLQAVARSHVTDCTWKNQSIVAGGAYGVKMTSHSRDLVVSNCLFDSGRNFFTTTCGTNSIVPYNAVISNCIANNTDVSGFGTHPGARNILFIGCRAMGNGVGFNLRGTNLHVVGCAVMNTNPTGGASVSAGVQIADGADGSIVQGNYFWKCDIGVFVNDSKEALIKGNTIVDSTDYAIHVNNPGSSWPDYVEKIWIFDNDIFGDPSNAAINFESGTWKDNNFVNNNFIPDASVKYSGVSKWFERGESKVDIVEEATTSRTLALTDRSSLIRLSDDTECDVTVPADADVPFSIGTQIMLRSVGDGTYTVVADDGVTVNPPKGGSLVLSGDATLIKVGTDEWDLVGETVAT